jgi:hypothetical protein
MRPSAVLAKKIRLLLGLLGLFPHFGPALPLCLCDPLTGFLTQDSFTSPESGAACVTEGI